MVAKSHSRANWGLIAKARKRDTASIGENADKTGCVPVWISLDLVGRLLRRSRYFVFCPFPYSGSHSPGGSTAVTLLPIQEYV